MKLTKTKLSKLIREEIAKTLKETEGAFETGETEGAFETYARRFPEELNGGDGEDWEITGLTHPDGNMSRFVIEYERQGKWSRERKTLEFGDPDERDRFD